MKLSTSQKSGWIKFFSISLLYMLLVIADIYTTYLYTPELTMEANPLVTLGGAGWKELIIEDIIVFIIFSFFAYYPFVYYNRTIIQCKGFKEYISMLYFERPDKFNWFFIKSPKNKMLYLVSAGYAFSIMFIILRLLAVLNNISCIINFQPCILCFFKIPHTYCNTIVLKIGSGQFIIPFVMLTIVVLVTFLSVSLCFFREYKINKKALNDLENTVA